MLIGVLTFASPAIAQTATEKAEKRIAELVAPGSSVTPMHAQPIAWKANRVIEDFDVPARSVAVMPVRLQQSPVKGVKPQGVPEAQPLVSFRDESQGPKQPELPTKPLIKLPSVDTTTPLALPILALPLADTPPLGEPAFGGLHAAMKPSRRCAKRRRLCRTICDPFEHVRYGRYEIRPRRRRP